MPQKQHDMSGEITGGRDCSPNKKEVEMHTLELQELIECCRQRESDGDRPRQARPSAERLEDAVLDLASDNDKLRSRLANEREWIANKLNQIRLAMARLDDTMSD